MENLGQLEIEENLELSIRNKQNNKYCRTCLRNLCDDTIILDRKLLYKLVNIAKVNVNADSETVKCICADCVKLLNASFAFKQLCERSDQIIHKYYYKSSKKQKSCNDSSLSLKGIQQNISIEEILDNIEQETLLFLNNDLNYNSTKQCDSYSIKVEPIDDSLDIFNNSSVDLLDCNDHVDFSSDGFSQSQNDYSKTISVWTNNVNLKNENKTNFELENKSDAKEKEADKHICNMCAKMFTELKKLKRHLRTHLSEKPFVCKTCGKGFVESGDLRRHSKVHLLKRKNETSESEMEGKLRCNQCPLTFSSEGDLSIHSSVHSEENKCLHCNKQFKFKIQLKRHVRIHLSDKPHKCKVCHKGFPERGSLTRHFRLHSGELRERKHVCRVCNKAYFDRSSLNIHERLHTGEKPWICSQCGKGFTDARLLNSHMKTHSDVRPYFCTICNKNFKHESTLITHVRTHTGEKPFICSVCGSSFIQSSNLALHMRTHTKEKPYPCEICAKKFASSSALKCHIRIHTGEKPYACKLCDKKFTRFDMPAHMKIHDEEKSCNKRFATTAQLNNHIKMHRGERPFTCTICSKGYATSSLLKKHLSKTHQVLAADRSPDLNMENKSIIPKTNEKSELPVNYEMISPMLHEKVMASEFVSTEVISCGQSLTLPENCTLNIVRLSRDNTNIDLSTDALTGSALEHQLTSDPNGVSSKIQILADDKLFHIDSNLLRLHHMTAANLVETGEITVREITDSNT